MAPRPKRYPRLKKTFSKIQPKCHVSSVICHMSCVMCHVSPVNSHLSPLTCHLSSTPTVTATGLPGWLPHYSQYAGSPSQHQNQQIFPILKIVKLFKQMNFNNMLFNQKSPALVILVPNWRDTQHIHTSTKLATCRHPWPIGLWGWFDAVQGWIDYPKIFLIVFNLPVEGEGGFFKHLK